MQIFWRLDIKHNDIHHEDAHNNNTQHVPIQYRHTWHDSQHNDSRHNRIKCDTEHGARTFCTMTLSITINQTRHSALWHSA